MTPRVAVIITVNYYTTCVYILCEFSNVTGNASSGQSLNKLVWLSLFYEFRRIEIIDRFQINL